MHPGSPCSLDYPAKIIFAYDQRGMKLKGLIWTRKAGSVLIMHTNMLLLRIAIMTAETALRKLLLMRTSSYV